MCVAAAAGAARVRRPRFDGKTPTQLREINELVALSQKIPSQADWLRCRASAAAFDALAHVAQRYRDAREALGPDAQNFGASTDLLKHSQAILGSREAVASACRRRRPNARALVPQLLQSLGNVVSALGLPRASKAA